MRKAILVLAVCFSALGEPVLSGEPSPAHPPQWQYRPVETVPDTIPNNRCIRAIFGKELEKETGRFWGEWDPPISENMQAWLAWKRADGKLELQFCDPAST